jgi:hypothetical protein
MGRKTCDRLRVGLLLTLAFCTLAGCGKKDDGADAETEVLEGLPQEYGFEEEKVEAPVMEGATAFTQEKVEGGAVYTYTGLTEPGQTSADYASALTEGEDPFSVVTSQFYLTDDPDYTQETGSVYLARDAAVEGSVCVLRLDWDLETQSCTVTTSTEEGQVTEPPPEPIGGSSGGSLTVAGAVDYVKSFTPTQLGLEGSSMEEYKVYAQDGSVYVDGMPCMKVKVCSVDSEQQFNRIEGNYLITTDKLHMYSLDEAAGTVKELPI